MLKVTDAYRKAMQKDIRPASHMKARFGISGVNGLPEENSFVDTEDTPLNDWENPFIKHDEFYYIANMNRIPISENCKYRFFSTDGKNEKYVGKRFDVLNDEYFGVTDGFFYFVRSTNEFSSKYLNIEFSETIDGEISIADYTGDFFRKEIYSGHVCSKYVEIPIFLINSKLLRITVSSSPNSLFLPDFPSGKKSGSDSPYNPYQIAITKITFSESPLSYTDSEIINFDFTSSGDPMTANLPQISSTLKLNNYIQKIVISDSDNEPFLNKIQKRETACYIQMGIDDVDTGITQWLDEFKLIIQNYSSDDETINFSLTDDLQNKNTIHYNLNSNNFPMKITTLANTVLSAANFPSYDISNMKKGEDTYTFEVINAPKPESDKLLIQQIANYTKSILRITSDGGVKFIQTGDTFSLKDSDILDQITISENTDNVNVTGYYWYSRFGKGSDFVNYGTLSDGKDSDFTTVCSPENQLTTNINYDSANHFISGYVVFDTPHYNYTLDSSYQYSNGKGWVINESSSYYLKLTYYGGNNFYLVDPDENTIPLPKITAQTYYSGYNLGDHTVHENVANTSTNQILNGNNSGDVWDNPLCTDYIFMIDTKCPPLTTGHAYRGMVPWNYKNEFKYLYSFSTRGFPEIEPGDIILFQKNKMTYIGTVIENTINYNGTLSGSITAYG